VQLDDMRKVKNALFECVYHITQYTISSLIVLYNGGECHSLNG